VSAGNLGLPGSRLIPALAGLDRLFRRFPTFPHGPLLRDDGRKLSLDLWWFYGLVELVTGWSSGDNFRR